MITISLLDAIAASIASAVVALSLTLGSILVLRLGDHRRLQARLSLEAYKRGDPRPSERVDASQWLVLLLVLSALISFGDAIHHLRLFSFSHWLSPFHVASLLLLGPTIWSYARAITELPQEKSQGRSDFVVHSIPSALAFCTLCITVVLDPEPSDSFSPIRSDLELLLLLPIAIHILVYLYISAARVRTRRKMIESLFSQIYSRKLNWFLIAISTLALLVLAWIVSWRAPIAISNIITNGLLAIDVALLGIFGAQQKNIFGSYSWVSEVDSYPLRGIADYSASPLSSDRVVKEHSSPQQSRADDLKGHDHSSTCENSSFTDARPEKYLKSALPPALATVIATRLNDFMTSDKPYLESDLTLGQLASSINVTPHQLSQVLSVHMRVSFFEYVNGYRVSAVKATLARPQSAGRSLLEVALECGFGSKSAFNEAFKKSTGLSPSEYRKSLPATAINSDN